MTDYYGIMNIFDEPISPYEIINVSGQISFCELISLWELRGFLQRMDVGKFGLGVNWEAL